MRKHGFERVYELPSGTSPGVQDLLLQPGVNQLPKIDVDKSKLATDCLGEPSSRLNGLADVI